MLSIAHSFPITGEQVSWRLNIAIIQSYWREPLFIYSLKYEQHYIPVANYRFYFKNETVNINCLHAG